MLAGAAPNPLAPATTPDLLVKERNSLSLQFIELFGIKADTGSPIRYFTHKMVSEE